MNTCTRDTSDPDAVRARFAKFSDVKLAKWIRACDQLCAPDPISGKAPRKSFVIQRQLAEEEVARQAATLKAIGSAL